MLKKNEHLMTAEDHRKIAEKHKAALKSELKIFFRTGLFTIAVAAVIIILTMAWFANNREVNSNGMKTQVDVSSNLIIAIDPKDLLTKSDFSVEFNQVEMLLDPARHKDGADYPVLLEYNTNPRVVSATTGLKSNSIDLKFDKVPVYSSEYPKRYYFDYTVYIASLGKEFTAKKLNATMDLLVDDEGELKDYMYASTIDFYLEDEYKGTLNKAGKNWTNNGQGLSSINLIKKDTEIPLNTSGRYLTILMRCYFDGGLLKDTNQTYVYSEGLITDGYSMTAHFEAVDAE